MIEAMPKRGREIIGRLRERERGAGRGEKKRESEWESIAGSVRAEPSRSADSVTHDSTPVLPLSSVRRNRSLYSIIRTDVTNVVDFGARREDFTRQVGLERKLGTVTSLLPPAALADISEISRV